MVWNFIWLRASHSFLHLYLEHRIDGGYSCLVRIGASDDWSVEADRVRRHIRRGLDGEHLPARNGRCQEGDDGPRAAEVFGDVVLVLGEISKVIRRVRVVMAVRAVGYCQVWDT